MVESDEVGEALIAEGGFLGGGLEFDELAGTGQDYVHIHFSLRILVIGEVEHGHASYNADAGCGHHVAQRVACKHSVFEQFLHGEIECDVAACDGRGAGATVGLKDVAINDDDAFAERFHVVTARRLRPMRRWISWVRPEGLPLVISRGVRVAVALGSMEYSAVTQPLPLLRRKDGTESSTEAAQSTRV